MTTPNEELHKLAEAVSGEYNQMKHTTDENIARAHKFQAFSFAASNPATIIALFDTLQSQAERIKELVKALELAVKQNSHDMLMTGEELRKCEAALSKYKGAK